MSEECEEVEPDISADTSLAMAREDVRILQEYVRKVRQVMKTSGH
jgi:hypothetical protein